jgi:hypothetical protein
MPLVDVYVGTLDDPDDRWDRLPRGLGPAFPPCSGKPFYLVVRRIRDGVYQGQQVDWGGWVAVVSKRQILELARECYEGDRTYLDPAYMPHLYPMMKPFSEFLDSLDEDTSYALTAFET